MWDKSTILTKEGEGLGNIGSRMGKRMISDAIGYRDADEVLKKEMVSGGARVSGVGQIRQFGRKRRGFRQKRGFRMGKRMILEAIGYRDDDEVQKRGRFRENRDSNWLQIGQLGRKR